MSVNRERPHILILPEDDANRQLAIGFVLAGGNRQIQVLNEAGGWLNVCARFENEHIQAMGRYPLRSIILLIDFDEAADRREYVRAKIPPHLVDRVFVLGSWIDPEALKRAFSRSCEAIGRGIADECHSQDRTILMSDLLVHNASELEGLCRHMASIG